MAPLLPVISNILKTIQSIVVDIFPSKKSDLLKKEIDEQERNEELLKTYYEREARWASHSVTQLSFFNNLLLTLAIGFLSFSYKQFSFANLAITFTKIDWSITFIVISITLTVLSAIFGMILALNRLLDFQLTRRTNHVRHRMFKYYRVRLDGRSFDRSYKYKFFKRFFLFIPLLLHLPVILVNPTKGGADHQQNISDIKRKFNNLRIITFNLGIGTWKMIGIQVGCFTFSLIFYLLGVLSK